MNKADSLNLLVYVCAGCRSCVGSTSSFQMHFLCFSWSVSIPYGNIHVFVRSCVIIIYKVVVSFRHVGKTGEHPHNQPKD